MVYQAKSAQDVQEIVADAAARKTPLEVIGHGSKRAITNADSNAPVLDLSGLSGIRFYEPEELVMSAWAGTPLVEIEAVLAKHQQRLAFEPMCYGPVFGEPDNRGTIGGVFATNTSGPRRLTAGAARDHILGVEAVSGRGESFKGGGRVVKNVTGFDMPKALAGSWGTLAVMTSVTFKVSPAAESEAAVIVRTRNDAEGAGVMARAMASNAEVTCAAHLPGPGETMLRLEGTPSSIPDRAGKLRRALDSPAEVLPQQDSAARWKAVRDLAPLLDGTQQPLWRVSLPPTAGHRFVAAVRASHACAAYYDWQGGLVWLRMADDPYTEDIRRHLTACGGGHATLIRAAAGQRVKAPAFQPVAANLAALSARLKQAFDPLGILNPGRMD